ncbi:MAG TPA: SRPBCC family protein [Nitrososphaeraceae archaeon]|nr:SRPBCC family protein [Nitrososphaeraceae archaeon]
MIKYNKINPQATRTSINLQPVIPAVIFVVMGMVFAAIPQVFATSLNVTREISAPADQVWNIISNVDNETQYWSTFKEIKNINKTDDIIEREVTISAGPQNNTSHQIVTLYPRLMKIQTNLTEGLVTGTRILQLDPISENKTRVDAIWDIDLSSIPIIGRGFAENGIKQSTDEALSRIAQAVE